MPIIELIFFIDVFIVIIDVDKSFSNKSALPIYFAILNNVDDRSFISYGYVIPPTDVINKLILLFKFCILVDNVLDEPVLLKSPNVAFKVLLANSNDCNLVNNVLTDILSKLLLIVDI